MRSYNPNQPPEPEAWSALPDAQRFKRVRRVHRLLDKKKVNIDVHAILHVIVENQIAANDPPETARAVERLVGEGLDRHTALHAAALVITDHIPEGDDIKPEDLLDESVNEALAADMGNLDRATYEGRIAEAEDQVRRRGLSA